MDCASDKRVGYEGLVVYKRWLSLEKKGELPQEKWPMV